MESGTRHRSEHIKSIIVVGDKELIYQLDTVVYPEEHIQIHWGEIRLSFYFKDFSHDAEKMNISFHADDAGGHITLENFNQQLGSTFSVEVGVMDDGRPLTVRGFISSIISSKRTTRFVHIDFLAAGVPL